MWIFGHNRNNYGIRYLYDSSTNGTADKIEFHGGHATNTTAWIQLDTGDASFGIIKDGTWNGSIIGVTYGGTGKNNAKDACNAFINALDTGDSVLTANDYMITQYVNGGTTTTTYHRRKASNVRVGGLTTGRTLKVSLGSTSASTAFDGTANISDIGVSGTLGVGNGGTGKASWTKGGIIYASATDTLTQIADGSADKVLRSTASATYSWLSYTSSSTASTIVYRDASKNFSAGTITASLSGNATSATKANITSNKYGISYYSDTAGTFATTAQGTSGYLLQAGGSSAAPSWIQATNANTASTIVKRDASGNFSAGTITATLSGNATSASAIKSLGRQTSTDITHIQNGGLQFFLVDGNTTTNKPASDGFILHAHWDGAASNAWDAQLFIPDGHSGHMQFRGHSNATTWGSSWNTLLDTGNYSSYALPLSGGTMTGDLKGSKTNILGDTAIANHWYKLYLGGQTVGSNAIDSATPLIEFSNVDRSQYCQLIYSDYDSVVAPDSLTLIGNQAGTHFIAPKINAGGYINNSYTMSTASFICESWVRTKGATGWYNEDYGGGWYMPETDTTNHTGAYVKLYGNKQVVISSSHTTSATNKSSQLIVSSVAYNGNLDTANAGAVAIELWRGGNGSWQIINDGGNLHFKNNWTTAKQTTYTQDSVTIAYNTGNTSIAGTLTAGGDISTTNGLLKSTKNSNTMTIGSQNTSYGHIYNSANIPIAFNNTILTTDGNLGNTTFPWNNLYIGKSDGAGIYYTNGTTTTQMIRFLTGDGGGHGIQIGGGGAALFGSGESAGTVRTGLSLGGATEQVYITSDNEITFFANQQNGYNSAAKVTIESNKVWAGVNGDTTYEAEVGVQSGSGKMYMYASASTTGSRGIYVPAHGTGSAKNVFSVNTNNTITFATGYFGSGSIIKAGNPWPGMYFGTSATTTTYTMTDQDAWAQIFYQAPAKNNSSNSYYAGRFFFRQYSHNGSGTRNSYYENYLLPTVTASMGANKDYAILTSKGFEGTSTNWNKGRDNAQFKMTALNGYSPAISIKTSAGSWDIGAYTNSADMLIFSYVSDSFYSGTNAVPPQILFYNNFIRVVGSGERYVEAQNSATTCRICIDSNGNGEHGLWSNGYYNSSNTFVSSSAWLLKRDRDSYAKCGTRLYGAVWNDYAEYRIADIIEPGRVVIEQKNGKMTRAQERLAPGAKVISDTYGFAIGQNETAKTPIAVSGRVLVYPYRAREEYELGAAVCSAPNGTVDIMTREEIMMYPERIVGTVSEIPTYDIWHGGSDGIDGPKEDTKINGRIWIYVK